MNISCPSFPASFCEISRGRSVCFEYLRQNSSIDSCFLLEDDFTSTGIIFEPVCNKKSTS
ncbi:MAG: hypothetical protein SOX89_01315 [Treponema sp.]|nr:hypothetical protein [Treponema sp.]